MDALVLPSFPFGAFCLFSLALLPPFSSGRWPTSTSTLQFHCPSRLALAVRSLCVLILFCAIPQGVDMATVELTPTEGELTSVEGRSIKLTKSKLVESSYLQLMDLIPMNGRSSHFLISQVHEGAKKGKQSQKQVQLPAQDSRGLTILLAFLQQPGPFSSFDKYLEVYICLKALRVNTVSPPELLN